MPATDNVRQTGSSIRQIQLWLLTVLGLIFAIILVGGATRLTDSGLSITEWQPIIGVIPPLNDTDWGIAFEKYRQIPEYKIINKGMSLAAFKQIYWWEWGHRLLGRVIGAAFLGPLIWFWWRGQLGRRLGARLGLIFLLGGLQGVVGWYMVKSGLVDQVDVSQYRLAAHLGLAVALFGLILWTLLRLTSVKRNDWAPGEVVAIVLVGLIFIQILSGAFVAGLDAGQAYNTWPLIDGSVVPTGLLVMTPWFANFFENALTVQFDHRMLAYIIAAIALLHALDQWRVGRPADPVGAAGVLAMVIVQGALGIWALVSRVPFDLSLLHQGGAVVLFSTAIWHLNRLVTVRPSEEVKKEPA